MKNYFKKTQNNKSVLCFKFNDKITVNLRKETKLKNKKRTNCTIKSTQNFVTAVDKKLSIYILY